MARRVSGRVEKRQSYSAFHKLRSRGLGSIGVSLIKPWERGEVLGEYESLVIGAGRFAVARRTLDIFVTANHLGYENGVRSSLRETGGNVKRAAEPASPLAARAGLSPVIKY